LDDSGALGAGNGPSGGWRTWRVVLALSVAGLAAYWNTFSAPFVFDDIPAIAQNPTIRDLGRPSELLAPPALRGSGAAGRPLVNLSLALNRVISGEAVWSYHAFNLIVHIGAGLALFGLVRRTLRLPRLLPWRGGADGIAFAAALLWLLHPLQTESVTCIIQRTESLCGLFYLFTFYAFSRAAQYHQLNDNAGRGRWLIACMGGCLAGSGTKELMVTAPVLLVLFDRTFVAGTFREAWAQRGRWHATLMAATAVIVGLLIWRSESRGGTVGFGQGVAWWEYALTQCRALMMYLKLAAWPHPLVLDYGTDVVREVGAVWPQALLLLPLLGATTWALVRRPFDGAQGRPMVGFLGAWCFVILAPSSSVVPLVTQTMAEHRMYLPLAALVVAAVVALHALARRAFWPAVAAIAVACGALTLARNHTYRSVEGLWRDNLAHRPGNPRAHYTLAELAEAAGRSDAAIAYGEAVLRLLPADATARFNLGFSLAKAGRTEEAIAHYREAVRLRPEAFDARINLGAGLVRLGRYDEAIVEYEWIVGRQPDSGEDVFNLGQAYLAAGRPADAIARFERAAMLLPNFAAARNRLGHAWVRLQRYEEASRAFREAIRLEPAHFEAHANLGGALLASGRPADAIPVLEAALRLQPGDPAATGNLARARAAAGR
jgi:tetratricopeptide (TPR) repeat protein